jgi:hypothetical protein
MTKHYIYQETTEWADSNGANHVYVFDARPAGRQATCVAYVPHGSDQVHKLKTPLKLDLKGRTFEEIS